MKHQRPIRHFAPLLVILAACSFVAGCATLGSVASKIGVVPSKKAVAAARLTPAERDFVTRAAARGMYEIEVSRLAVDRAVDAGVRAFAQMMVRDRTRANRELVELMSARGLAPPRGLAAEKATKLQRLASLPPSAAFDHAYVRVVGIEDHRSNIAAFERARRHTRDRELQAWIDKTLGELRGHLTAAQSLVGTLAG